MKTLYKIAIVVYILALLAGAGWLVFGHKSQKDSAGKNQTVKYTTSIDPRQLSYPEKRQWLFDVLSVNYDGGKTAWDSTITEHTKLIFHVMLPSEIDTYCTAAYCDANKIQVPAGTDNAVMTLEQKYEDVDNAGNPTGHIKPQYMNSPDLY